ncbi:STAS/SEC14 domain-containing protein [Pseudonocardia alni]|uniref:STAS/SEC14 domain-containing protein n=1 Tax=Pseudonocardia alni TaxID=33907 RepID=UPI00331D6FCE
MLETIPTVPQGVVGLRAVGLVDRADFARTIEPIVEEAIRLHRPLRLLLQLGPEYEGFTAGAAWEKTEMWLEHPTMMRFVAGYALVSDIGWVRDLAHLVGVLLPFPMRVFGNDRLDEAAAWLRSLEHTAPEAVGG